MNYQEAIREAETQINMYESMILYNKDFEPKNDNSNYERKVDFLKTAISSMQELQLYKDTGLTPDQLREIDKLYSEQAKELGEYREIGTLDEVREAVEKQKKKKPCTSNRCYVCPHCGLVTSLKTKHNYCDACGQHIDWSEKK